MNDCTIRHYPTAAIWVEDKPSTTTLVSNCCFGGWNGAAGGRVAIMMPMQCCHFLSWLRLFAHWKYVYNTLARAHASGFDGMIMAACV